MQVSNVQAPTPHPNTLYHSPQTWCQPLWPYSREQDGVFVQLQAVLPKDGDDGAGAGTEPGRSGSKVSGSKAAAGAQRQKDVGKADQEATAAANAQTRQLAKLWFVRLGERVEGGGFKLRTPHELPQDLALLPSLLR